MSPLAKMLIDMARFYNYDLAKSQLDLFVKVLSQFPQEQVLEAGREYIYDTRNSRFPIPVHKILKNEVEDDDVAKEVAGRIVQSVTKYGWNNARDAEYFIGPLGWNIVQRFGGWTHVCENLGVTMQPGQFYAQARDLARSQMSLAKSGVLDSPFALPESKKETKKFNGNQLLIDAVLKVRNQGAVLTPDQVAQIRDKIKYLEADSEQK